MSIDEMGRILQPYIQRLMQGVRQGDRQLNEKLSGWRHMAESRSISSLRNDFIVAAMREIFAGDRNVRFELKRGRWLMYIEERIVVVFKKLDSRRRPWISPTQFSMRLFGQLELPDMPPEAPRLVNGWQTDEFNQSVTTILMTLPIGRHVGWSLRLDDEPPTATITATPPPPDGKGPRVIKAPGIKKGERADAGRDKGSSESGNDSRSSRIS